MYQWSLKRLNLYWILIIFLITASQNPNFQTFPISTGCFFFSAVIIWISVMSENTIVQYKPLKQVRGDFSPPICPNASCGTAFLIINAFWWLCRTCALPLQALKVSVIFGFYVWWSESFSLVHRVLVHRITKYVSYCCYTEECYIGPTK